MLLFFNAQNTRQRENFSKINFQILFTP